MVLLFLFHGNLVSAIMLDRGEAERLSRDSWNVLLLHCLEFWRDSGRIDNVEGDFVAWIWA